MIAIVILVSSVNAQGSPHFYTLPDAEMAAREQQELQDGFVRTKSSKKSPIANKDWMGTPVSRQQRVGSSSSSLRKNKLKKEQPNADTIGREPIRNIDQLTNTRRPSSARASIEFDLS